MGSASQFRNERSCTGDATGEIFRIKVRYKPKPRLKVRSEQIDLSTQLIKGVSSRGNQVSRKEIKEIIVETNTLKDPPCM